MTRRAHLLAVVLVGLALSACGEDDAALAAAHPRPFAPAPTTTDVASSGPAVARPRQDLDTLDHGTVQRAGPTAPPPPPPPPSAPTLAEAPAPQERSLPAELATAIGSPASCLDLATARALHGRLTVQVSATVTPAGNVTRARASGGGLPPAALACIQARALGAHLSPPIEGAPRSISTTLAFEVTTTADETTTETPVWRQPGAVADPGVVLPAVGASGRPEGALAPDSTLPAVVPAGRQEGTVAPDIVLPARGR